jgi:NAD(P)-dependent dehydrogenase (short-subunit alcohol dehydrogenase family)
MSKVWFITGSSRGLGRELAEAVLAAGHRLVATARKREDLQPLVDRRCTCAGGMPEAARLRDKRFTGGWAHVGAETERPPWQGCRQWP